ncbi:MAG: hypothetical protein EU542_00650 [Promethearchaeota archaeon]|nr:MAG: hypothetical protein EU542_00650 [Candidatus Lokiarchaeota archaeon]
MTFDIFRVDWILIDSIIILILIIILCSVKIYKIKHRWRNSIVNDSISKINLDPHDIEFDNNKFYVKKWNLFFNPNLLELRPHMPTIFMFSSKSLHYLPYAILEGLCSYGFTVNHMLIKRRWDLFKKQEEILDPKNQSILRLTFNYLKSDYPKKISQRFWIIDFKSFLSYKELKNFANDKIGLILINPSIEQLKFNSLNFEKEIKFDLIFSKKSFLWFRNRKISKSMVNFSQLSSENVKITVFENTNMYFKNYETILLAKLIMIIKNNIK